MQVAGEGREGIAEEIEAGREGASFSPQVGAVACRSLVASSTTAISGGRGGALMGTWPLPPATWQCLTARFGFRSSLHGLFAEYLDGIEIAALTDFIMKTKDRTDTVSFLLSIPLFLCWLSTLPSCLLQFDSSRSLSSVSDPSLSPCVSTGC